jgi:hypothetical protein
MPSTPDGPPAGAEDSGGRQLREIASEQARAARLREPSAAGRARNPAQLARGRDSRKTRRLREPATGPPAGPPTAWIGHSPPPWREPPSADLRRSRSMSLAVVAVVVACVAGGVAAVIWLSGERPAASGPGSAGNGPAPALPSTASAADPFAGSPAVTYADGSAGIVVPAAHPTGRFSAEQVRAAYRTARKMIIAAELNQRTLGGGRPAAFTRLLISAQRNYFLAHLGALGVSKRGIPRSTRGWVSSFAPGSTQLVGTVIKVHGILRARPAVLSRRHVLQVHADYLFVYPVQQPGQRSTLMRIVQRVTVDVDFAQWNDPGGPLEPWWYPVGASTAGASCDVYDGFIHPAFPSGPPEKVKPAGPPVNPYSLGRPPDTGRACQATMGT